MTEFPAIQWAVESANTLYTRMARNEFQPALTTAESAHLAALQHPLRRRDWVTGRWTAKYVLRKLFPGDDKYAEKISIDYDTLGAPSVMIEGRRTGISLSISHCDGWAFCAAVGDDVNADEPRMRVGADIERVRAAQDDTLFDLLTPEERAQVLMGGDPGGLAAAYWCAKEAAGKALRTGLGLNPDRFICRLDMQKNDAVDGWKPLAVSVESRTLAGRYRILELEAGSRYALALVVDATPPGPLSS